MLSANRRRVKLIDRAARRPAGARGALVRRRARRPARRCSAATSRTASAARLLRRVPDVPAAARLIPRDVRLLGRAPALGPHLRSVDDAVARATVVHFVVHALVARRNRGRTDADEPIRLQLAATTSTGSASARPVCSSSSTARMVFNPAPFYHIRNAELVVRHARRLRLHRPLAHAALLPARRLVARRRRCARAAPAASPRARLRLLVPLARRLRLFDAHHQVPRARERPRPEPHRLARRAGAAGGLPLGDPGRAAGVAPPFTRRSSSSCPTFFTRLDRFTWAHLWFVAYLFTSAALSARSFSRLLRRPCAHGARSPAWLYAPTRPLALVQLVLRPLWPGIQNLYDDWANVAYYSTFFLAGFLLAWAPAFEAALAAEWRRALGRRRDDPRPPARRAGRHPAPRGRSRRLRGRRLVLGTGAARRRARISRAAGARRADRVGASDLHPAPAGAHHRRLVPGSAAAVGRVAQVLPAGHTFDGPDDRGVRPAGPSVCRAALSAGDEDAATHRLERRRGTRGDDGAARRPACC